MRMRHRCDMDCKPLMSGHTEHNGCDTAIAPHVRVIHELGQGCMTIECYFGTWVLE